MVVRLLLTWLHGTLRLILAGLRRLHCAGRLAVLLRLTGLRGGLSMALLHSSRRRAILPTRWQLPGRLNPGTLAIRTRLRHLALLHSGRRLAISVPHCR